MALLACCVFAIDSPSFGQQFQELRETPQAVFSHVYKSVLVVYSLDYEGIVKEDQTSKYHQWHGSLLSLLLLFSQCLHFSDSSASILLWPLGRCGFGSVQCRGCFDF